MIFDIWQLGIISIAGVLRWYRLSELTEFLGDQGRTMLVMRDFVERGVIPLAGPTTLSGHNLGPFFYYLLLPGYLVGGGNPFVVSLWMTLLGVGAVVVLYKAIQEMFGVWPARLVSLLWAISPFIIASDRVIWEPNLVPLFALFFAYLLYRADKENRLWQWMSLGGVVGILVQLHYPNIFFIGITALYMGYKVVMKRINYRMLGVLGGFVLVLTPFIIHEFAVEFRDITGIGAVFSTGVGTEVGKRMMLDTTLENAFRIFGRALPFMSKQSVLLVALFWAVFILRYPTKKNIFLSLWLGGGFLGMARYTGVVHDHYLYFLVPVPFFMIASFLSTIKSPTAKLISIPLILFVSYFQLAKADFFKPGNNDISRVQASVETLKSEVGITTPFSFTLVDSRSFSDLHYRYNMAVTNLNPLPITNLAYETLFLICDQDTCDPVEKYLALEKIQALCYDGHCNEKYPTIDLRRDWRYKETVGRLYVFERI